MRENSNNRSNFDNTNISENTKSCQLLGLIHPKTRTKKSHGSGPLRPNFLIQNGNFGMLIVSWSYMWTVKKALKRLYFWF
jgi:hypothetical protein